MAGKITAEDFLTYADIQGAICDDFIATVKVVFLEHVSNGTLTQADVEIVFGIMQDVRAEKVGSARDIAAKLKLLRD